MGPFLVKALRISKRTPHLKLASWVCRRSAVSPSGSLAGRRGLRTAGGEQCLEGAAGRAAVIDTPARCRRIAAAVGVGGQHRIHAKKKFVGGFGDDVGRQTAAQHRIADGAFRLLGANQAAKLVGACMLQGDERGQIASPDGVTAGVIVGESAFAGASFSDGSGSAVTVAAILDGRRCTRGDQPST